MMDVADKIGLLMRPYVHILLGLQIAASLAVFVSGIYGLVGSFKRAGSAVDSIYNRARFARLKFAGWIGCTLASAGLSAAVLTYWLSVWPNH